MAKLVLSQIDNDGQQICLMSGQSCTIGSSAAADYTLASDQLEEIHCRITCRGNSCFIECPNFENKIVINGNHANRSSLNHGDTVQIGPFPMMVDFESNRVLPVELDDATTVSQDFDSLDEFESLEEVESLDDVSPILPVSPPETDGHNASLPAAEAVVERSPIDAPSTADTKGSAKSADPVPTVAPADSLDDASDSFAFEENSFEMSEIQERPDPPAKAESTVEPTVEPAVDPATEDSDLVFGSSPDVELPVVVENDWNSTELPSDQVELSDPEHSTTVIGKESNSEFDLDNNDSTLPDIKDNGAWRLIENVNAEIASSGDAKASEFLRSLANRSQLERKHGSQAVDFLKQMLAEKKTSFFKIHSRAIREAEFEPGIIENSEKQDSVYLVSSCEEQELQKILDEKRWLGRMKYAMGLHRFLELSPRKTCDSFFEVVQACLFVTANDECELITRAD